MPGFTAGTLYLVATPIGNLEDITLRAIRVLRECDLVAAEDTRRTSRLLNHLGISVPTTSVHEHNETSRAPAIVARLLAGACVALVSDAGTPGISDPGYRLVRAALDAGCRVEAVPGPSALIAALITSGLPTDAFVFMGFPPARGAARTAWFDRLADERRTVVFFESPHRIRRTLEQALTACGDRPAAIGRELTKLHEETRRGTLSTLLSWFQGEPIGEFTVVVAGAPDVAQPTGQVTPEQLFEEFCRMTETGGGRREAVTALARRYGLPAREVYSAIERARHG